MSRPTGRRKWIFEKSGWKWLDRYQVDFLKSAPALIVVVGDPQKTGADIFMEGGGVGYQLACAAAIQNMMLAAHALGLGTVWYTLFDRKAMGEILSIDSDKTAVSIICLGKAAGSPGTMARKEVKENKSVIFVDGENEYEKFIGRYRGNFAYGPRAILCSAGSLLGLEPKDFGTSGPLFLGNHGRTESPAPPDHEHPK